MKIQFKGGILLLGLAVFFLVPFVSAARADVGTEDVKVIDTDGDGVTHYRLTHPDYYIAQRTVANEGTTAYSRDDKKVLFYMTWDKSMRNPGVPNFCFNSSDRCQGYCYGEVDVLKNWWKNDKSREGWEAVCYLVPRSARHSGVYGVQWSELPGEDNILYGVDRYTGQLGKLDTSLDNPAWNYFMNLVPSGVSASDSGYNPKIHGFLNDGRMVVALSGENAWTKFGDAPGVAGYLVDLKNNVATPTSDYGAKSWGCLNSYYHTKYNYRFNYLDGKINLGSAHSDVRLINGEYWASDHGYEMFLLDKPPGVYDTCPRFAGESGMARNILPPSGHPSHLFYRDDDWFYSDHCQWGDQSFAPNLGKCYIVQRYWDTKTRTSPGDVMIVDWIYPRGWTRVYNKPYDISLGTPQQCTVDQDVNGDGSINQSDYDKYCQYNIKDDIYAYQATCNAISNKCQRIISNYYEFTGPNMNHGGTAMGFDSTEQGKQSYNDYLAYGKYNNWSRDAWDNNGFYHVEVQIGNANPADVNEDGNVNIKDIQACIKAIVDANSIPETYLNNCQKVAPPETTVNIKDIQEIIQTIVGR